jgi:ABC-type transporter Mla maintaining outer membrane lipid asymmetry ATPase subunit MlaF
VHLFGQDITQLEGDVCLPQRLRVGLVFQEGTRLFNQLSVAHNVSLPLCYHRNCAPAAVADEVAALLEVAGLEREAALTPARLNRGIRLRVGLARALALKPELLLLDNPLAGLDAREEHWWLELVARLAAGDKTLPHCPRACVLTTDRLTPWRDLGRQFAVIHDRQWQVIGSAAALAEEKHPILREFLTNA